MPLQMNVTSQTTLQDLNAFAQLAGDNAKIRGKIEKDGSVTLYASHKKSGSFDWLNRLFGGQSRASKQEVAQQAIATILRNSSSLGPENHDRLIHNAWDGVPGGRGRELRTEGLQKVVGASTPLLQNTVEFGGKIYTKEKALGSDGCGQVDLYRGEDGEAIVLKRPKEPSISQPGSPDQMEGYLQRLYQAREDANQVLREEITVHRHIQESGEHPNILPMLGELTGPLGEPVLVLPFAPKGDAFDLGHRLNLARETGQVDSHQGELMGLTMLRDVGESLRHLHERAGVLHLDMKPENYLIDGEGRLRLSDFGTSMIGVQQTLTTLHPVENDRYTSPEDLKAKERKGYGDPGIRDRLFDLGLEQGKLIRSNKNAPPTEEMKALQAEIARLKEENSQIKQNQTIPLGPKSDTWTLGIMAYCMLVDSRPHARSPFRDANDGGQTSHETLRILAFGEGSKTILDQVLEWHPDDQDLRTRIENLSPEARDLVNGLLHPDPERRMTLEQALSNPLFQQEGVGSEEIRQGLLNL
ncbi:protein kinase domain-containing protein [Castellaniella defragrans]|uniref:protein kinase domain-containing protein n=1 Tax=Castellaniella defragrans TaxID=75697 RepID=UPI0023F0821F|nr:protein kinase [Castellaniella defragrans]